MPNTLLHAWVKNVYSLFKAGGKTSDYLPTISILQTQFPIHPVHKYSRFPRFIPAFPQGVSTPKITSLPLLKSYFYPLSTPPINTKTKGK